MSFIRQTNPRIALALLAGAVLVVALCLKPSPEGSDSTGIHSSLEPVPGGAFSAANLSSRSSRQTASEFLAARKKTHIERLLAGVTVVLREQDLLLRSEYLQTQIESLTGEDVPLVLQELNDELRNSEFGVLLLRRWADSSPQEAAQWVQGLSGGPERDGLLAEVGTVWAGRNLKEAFAWANNLPEAPGKQAALYSVAEEAVRHDPAEVLSAAASLADRQRREQLMIRAVNEWVIREPVEALRWVAGTLDESVQKPVREALVPVIASLDGASGARLVTAWLPPGQAQERAAVVAVQHWVQQSPESAEEWVNRFPEGAMRLAALDNLRRIRASMKADMDAPTLR